MLVLALVVLIAGFLVGAGLITLGTQSRLAGLNQVNDMSARLAADAGVDRAVQEINNAVAAKTWSAGVLPSASQALLPLTRASYSVSTQYDAAGGYQILSVGTAGNRTRRVQTILRLKGLFDNAIQCRNNIALKNGTVIDTIDSMVSLNPDDCTEKAIIGTNSTEASSIVLNNEVVIDGDVVVGVGGDTTTVIKDLGATFDQSYALSSAVEFPPVTAPSFTGPGTLIEVKSGQKTIGPGGDYPAAGWYSGIKLSQGTSLRVIGPSTVCVAGAVSMGQNSEIIVDSANNAALTVYLSGNWISGNGSGINNASQTPSKFQLYGTGSAGQQIDLKAKSDLYGVIYAPDAALTVFSGGNIYGSFVANDFELKNPANFYYDASLKNVSVTHEGARFVISRWNEQ
ncbi:MAG: hypothetical protein L0Y36_04025 [Planctomycetales bacterium]|nr:hypothetical protein [Planctomycetales bacterium]